MKNIDKDTWKCSHNFFFIIVVDFIENKNILDILRRCIGCISRVYLLDMFDDADNACG